MDAEDLRAVLATLRRLGEALEADRTDGGWGRQHQNDDTESADRPGPKRLVLIRRGPPWQLSISGVGCTNALDGQVMLTV